MGGFPSQCISLLVCFNNVCIYEKVLKRRLVLGNMKVSKGEEDAWGERGVTLGAGHLLSCYATPDGHGPTLPGRGSLVVIPVVNLARPASLHMVPVGVPTPCGGISCVNSPEQRPGPNTSLTCATVG